MEFADDTDNQIDSSSTGSQASKPLSKEDDDEEDSNLQTVTAPRGSVKNRSSPARAAGDE